MSEQTNPPAGPMARAYFEFLAEEGYRPRYDKDGDVEFKAEGVFFCLMANEDDPKYLYLTAPNICEIESEEEHIEVLKAAAEQQILFKGLKLVVTSSTVWACYQGFLPDTEAHRQVLPRAIDLLISSVAHFHRNMREKNAEAEKGEGVQA